MSADPLTQTPPSPPAREPKPRRRRWAKLLGGIFALLALLTWFAPAIVAKTPLLDYFARRAAAGLNGTVEIGGASLGWFSPVELRDVMVKDPRGRAVVTLPKVTSSKSLFSLIRSRADLGVFTLERPAVDVVRENGSTNLEEVLRAFLKEESPGPTRTQVTVRVTGGTLTLHNAGSGHADELRDIEATVTVPASRAEPVTAKVAVTNKLDTEITAGDSGRLKLVARAFPLEAIAPFLPHSQPGTALDGTLTCDVTATWANGGPVSVSACTLSLTAGADELHLKLLEPVTDAKEPSAGKLDARLTGDLARWRARVAAFVPIPKHLVLGGTVSARGTVRFTADGLTADRLTLRIDKARFRGDGLDIDEPQMDAVADLAVNRKTGTTAFENFTINSAPLTVTNGRLVIDAPENGELVVGGGGPAVVGLNRLGKSLRFYSDTRGPDALHGTATGSIHFRYSAGTTTFGGTLAFADFALGPKNDPTWAEAAMRLQADGSYTEATDTLAFKVAKIERAGLALDAAGTLGKFATTTDVNLKGTLTYDLAKLSPKLRELLGGDFAAQGKGTRPVSLVGNFTPQARPGSVPPGPFAGVVAEAGIGWDSLRAHGFDVGPGELHGKLANGVARFNPLTAGFGGGRVTVQPVIRLDPEPGELSFAKGLVVDRAKLTPAACASALGYALPAVAHATKAEGEISLVLDENYIPLGNAAKANARGHLLVHKATVTAGPVVGVIATVLGANTTTMTLAADTTVPVRVENGRVHHENFAMKLGAYTVHTSGSVGFDGSLDLVVDMPIPGGLPGLKNTPALAKALSGKRVQVPLKGTLSAPALDPKQLQSAIVRVAQDAAKDIGKELLNKELDKLFPAMPKK